MLGCLINPIGATEVNWVYASMPFLIGYVGHLVIYCLSQPSDMIHISSV